MRKLCRRSSFNLITFTWILKSVKVYLDKAQMRHLKDFGDIFLILTLHPPVYLKIAIHTNKGVSTSLL